MPRFATYLLAVFLLTACGADPDSGGDAPADRPQPIRSAAVERIDTDRQFALSGVARAGERAQLAFQVSGRLVERPASIGGKVRRGELLARLEQPELGPSAAAARARAEQLKTELAQAERDLARVRGLHEAAAATVQELESAQSRHDGLRAALQQARAEVRRTRQLLEETRLLAPVAGSVSQVYFEPGEFVPAGQPVVALSGSDLLEVEIGLPETLLDEVAVGDEATLTLPLVGGETTGRVIRLAGAAGGPGRLFPAVLALEPAPGLHPGVTVTWRLRSDEPERMTVPVAAIASTGGRSQPRVFRLVDGSVKAIPVALGAVVGERVVVAADLAAGDRVVTLGLDGLVDGRAVEERQ